jgi:SAM-dependent methyltransferase
MANVEKDPQKHLIEQYQTAANLNARIRLHQRFSTNPYGWHRWVFDQFHLPAQCNILELGCGAGDLLLENRDRIPQGWEIILTDFSAGMLQLAQERLQTFHPFRFELLDARSIPYRFESQSLDAVIANHMLFHISDREMVFAEIRRILKPGGYLFATTTGRRHLKEVAELLLRFDRELGSWGNVGDPFLLENGEEQLLGWFSEVKRSRYEDGLKVNEVAPLVEYILSGWTNIAREKERGLMECVERELNDRGGEFCITKDSGIFTAVRGRE